MTGVLSFIVKIKRSLPRFILQIYFISLLLTIYSQLLSLILLLNSKASFGAIQRFIPGSFPCQNTRGSI